MHRIPMLREDSGKGGGGRRNEPKNVMGDRLEVCSLSPMTGFFRDGCCDTSREDIGSHTVCAVMTAGFLEYSKSCGNDLSTPVLEFGFPGLKPGDRWCLCAPRWQEALQAGLFRNGGSCRIESALIRKVRVRRPRPEHEKGRARGGSEAARTVVAVLRLVLSWAIRENLVKRADNPASDMDKNLPKKRKKDRVLSLEEARIVWRAASSAGYAFGTHVQLMLLTAAGRGSGHAHFGVGST